MQLTEKLFKIPYKTCRLLILLELVLRFGFQKYQKSIRFFTINSCHFTTLQNIKKPLVKQRFAACKKVVQNTLSNLSIIDTFGAVFTFWLQKVSKSIRFFTINAMGFRHVEKPYKTCRKWRFLRDP